MRKRREGCGRRVFSNRANKLLSEKAECEGGMQRGEVKRVQKGKGASGRRWEDEWTGRKKDVQ